MRARRHRVAAVEYAKAAPLVSEVARAAGVSHIQARALIHAAGERVRASLDLPESPLAWVGDGVRFENVAGLLLLAPGVELEVAPKFLGGAEGWREDFFLLATLSQHGRLLDAENIQARASSASDLLTLIGRSFVEMYWRNRRRPLRTYRRLAVDDFALEGDFDPADLALPGEEGFAQQVTTFTRANPYNAVIGEAARRLAPVVSDPETRARLERLAHNLPRQPAPTRVDELTLPGRARAWQPVYDLAVDILRGLGGSFDPKNAMAPGFVLRTWEAWEALVTLVLRMAFGAGAVGTQQEFQLGYRTYAGAKPARLMVSPDNTVKSGGRTVLLDAKYKGNVEHGRTTISNADIYEALAFARATKARDVVLAYPCRLAEGAPTGPELAGGYREFATASVDAVTIRGVEFGVRGIAQPHGLRRLSQAFRSYLDGLPSPIPPQVRAATGVD